MRARKQLEWQALALACVASACGVDEEGVHATSAALPLTVDGSVVGEVPPGPDAGPPPTWGACEDDLSEIVAGACLACSEDLCEPELAQCDGDCRALMACAVKYCDGDRNDQGCILDNCSTCVLASSAPALGLASCMTDQCGEPCQAFAPAEPPSPSSCTGDASEVLGDACTGCGQVECAPQALACEGSDCSGLIACAVDSCAGLSGPELSLCAVQSCPDCLGGASPANDYVACLTARCEPVCPALLQTSPGPGGSVDGGISDGGYVGHDDDAGGFDEYDAGTTGGYDEYDAGTTDGFDEYDAGTTDGYDEYDAGAADPYDDADAGASDFGSSQDAGAGSGEGASDTSGDSAEAPSDVLRPSRHRRHHGFSLWRWLRRLYQYHR